MRELSMQEVKLVSGGNGNNTAQLLASADRALVKSADFLLDGKLNQSLHFGAKAAAFALRAANSVA